MKTSILFSSLLVCLLASFSLAFSDSTPLLAFSSHINHFLDKAIPDLLSSTPKSPVYYSDQIANALKGSKRKGLCGIDAVAIFEVQGVSISWFSGLFHKTSLVCYFWHSESVGSIFECEFHKIVWLTLPLLRVALATQLHSNSFRQSSSSSLKDLALSSPSHYAIQNVQGGSLSNRVRNSVLKECRSSGWGESRIQEVDQWNQVGNKKVLVVKADGVHDGELADKRCITRVELNLERKLDKRATVEEIDKSLPELLLTSRSLLLEVDIKFEAGIERPTI